MIIHPFEESIKAQYNKRKLLFNNELLLPDFKITVLKAVQSVAGNGVKSGFDSWFGALDYMKSRINEIDFDIAIIGCGAYGMPLAAHVKDTGKQAIHMGGETQIMFGIKGKRWENESYKYDKLYYNEHWVRPFTVDTPQNNDKVEGACYW